MSTQLDDEACYRALRARDDRFDGRLFVAVVSTGIYCRPICPAPPAKFSNCRFFPTAAAAQEAGFRPCLRCRPEIAPGAASPASTSRSVARALRLIEEGELDRERASVVQLADKLGLGERQLRRLFKRHLGASPIAVAQTRRVLLAKQLIHDTTLSMSEVAMAAGFGSVRRFNECFRELYAKPPGALRRTGARVEGSVAVAGVDIELPYRPPYDYGALLRHFSRHAIAGVERVTVDTYSRTIRTKGGIGTVTVRHDERRSRLRASIRCSEVSALSTVVSRLRRVFDVDADVTTIGLHLSLDSTLAPLVSTQPGLRLAGTWDGFEAAVRAVLGQQVSTAAARTTIARLVQSCGAVLPEEVQQGDLRFLFPTPDDVLASDLVFLGVPEARRETLRTLALAASGDPTLFQPLDTVDESVRRWSVIAGIGEWTAQVIALRALGEPDAFPATDVAIRRSLEALGAAVPTRAALLERAESWRPFRAYAAQHLWAAHGRAGAVTLTKGAA